MTRIPARITATIAHARIDELIHSSRGRAPVGDGPDNRHQAPVLRPAWWTRLTTAQLRSIPLT